MNLNKLKYFVSTVEKASITKAAQAHFVSQPTVSVAIKELETEYGTLLFHRIGRSITPTTEGEFLYKNAKTIIEDLESLTIRFNQVCRTEKVVKVGVPPMVGSFLFPNAFVNFKTKFPNIQFEISEMGSTDIINLIKEEVIDIAIVTGVPEAHLALNFELLLETELLYCVGNKHPLYHQSVIRYEQLRGEPIIFFPQGYFSRQLIVEYMKEHGIELNFIINCQQISTMKSFVQNNIASSFLMPEIIDNETIHALRFDKSIPISIYMTWKKDIFLHSELVKFLNFMRDDLQNGPRQLIL